MKTTGWCMMAMALAMAAMTGCHAGVRNPRLGLSLDIEFDKNQLPCLANWQHWGRGEYVTGLEPGTHFPVGQGAARRDGSLILLEPGESRRYALVFRVGAK